MSDDPILRAARERSERLLRAAPQPRALPSRYHLQRAHLTCPATVWKYVEGAVRKSRADLVLLDLEDSIPRGDEVALAAGRENVVRALRELDWGGKLRFFRPRGTALDPAHEDLAYVLRAAGDTLDGVTLPKVEDPEEVRSVDATLTALERERGLPEGSVTVQVLLESAEALSRAREFARCTPRLSGLVFGAFDYWSSLRVPRVAYRSDHPLVDRARMQVVEAAALGEVPALAEMTLEYPTRDKTPEQQRAALDACRRDAERARELGFAGKWTGIPAQTEVALEVFAPDPAALERAVREARAFLEAERAGRGAVMIDGRMFDRATDRVNRVLLAQARALGLLDEATARELALR